MLKFQIYKGLTSGQAFEPYFIGKHGMAITLTAFSDRFRNLRGAQRASGVLRLRRFRFGKRRQLREEIFRADAVAPTKKQSKMIRPRILQEARRPFIRFPISVKILLSMLPSRA